MNLAEVSAELDVIASVSKALREDMLQEVCDAASLISAEHGDIEQIRALLNVIDATKSIDAAVEAARAKLGEGEGK